MTGHLLLTGLESWVEIASQPSSSSLSSIGDEIVTTGLRVGGEEQTPIRQRRRIAMQHGAAHFRHAQTVIPHSLQAETSSQEEYEETESEEDRLMTSSTEHVQAPIPGLPRQQRLVGQVIESDSDDDDNGTALGRPSTSPTFRPQPNVFSHPPHHLQHRSHSTSAASPHQLHRPTIGQRAQTRVPRGGPNFMSPANREENEAALRASLTTLLSCAAAVSGRPKRDLQIDSPSGIGAGVRPSTQPMSLGLVPESELLAETPASAAQASRKTAVRTESNSSSPSGPVSTSSRDAADKGKRAATSGAQSKTSRATKKKRTSASLEVDGGEVGTFLSPTLFTWVVSAGVILLVSVVGFGAGYVIGREVGKQEGMSMSMSVPAGGASNATSCGRDIARSTTSGGTLRRFKWGANMARSAVA